MSKLKIKIITFLSFVLLSCLLLGVTFLKFTVDSAQAQTLISTRNAFINALNSAKNGDTILVDDIDFNLTGEGAVNEAELLIINKSVTIKSGKADGNAVFLGASFLLEGTFVAGEKTTYSFENVTFDEGLNADEITHTDWELSYYGDGKKISDTPIKCQKAIECVGNTNAIFTGCSFKNYMSPYGSAIQAWYLNGESSHCKLNITLDECVFERNSALNAGGAIYLRSKDNITLSAVNCKFTDNRSGFHDQSVGGGAVALYGCNSQFKNCEFTKNIGNYFYGGNRYFDFGYVSEMGENFILYDDSIAGGAIHAQDGSLSAWGCSFTNNTASFGGAVALVTITADIEDCRISNNNAISVLEDEYKNKNLGVESCNGIGGAIYIDGAKHVTIGNTEIAENYADSAYGGIYSTYTTIDSEFYNQFSLELTFCTIRNNACSVKISDYTNNDGRWEYDIHAIPYIKTFGCLILDEIYAEDIPKSENPTDENGFNFFGSSAPAEWYVGEHLLHAPVVSTDYIKEKLGDRNYYGRFTVGANNHDVTYKFFMDGECKDTVTISSGISPTIPNYEKIGHTLSTWSLEGFDYYSDRMFIVGNATESVNIHAVFVPNTYTVTYNFGEAKEEVYQTYGTELTPPTPQERNGYSFVGWFTAENGKGDRVVSGTLYQTAGDITYYAFYQKDFPTFYLIISIVSGVLIIGVAILAGFAIYRRKHPHLVSLPTNDAVITKKELPDTSMLSPREKEVLELLLQGKQRNEIATILYISENTVKKNISGIYTKLNVTSRNELFALFK